MNVGCSFKRADGITGFVNADVAVLSIREARRSGLEPACYGVGHEADTEQKVSGAVVHQVGLAVCRHCALVFHERTNEQIQKALASR